MKTNNNETFQKILDIGMQLVQERGYNGFSYADIAEAVGIRKASIHYYFPTKQELVQAVLLRYRKHFIEKLDQIDKSSSDAKEKLKGFFKVYRDTLEDNSKICLCSMMAAELNSFPEEIRNELTLFFRANEEWVENVLKQGINSGSLTIRSTDEVKQAKIIVAFVQGAQLLARSTGEIDYFDSLTKDFYDDFKVDDTAN